MTSMEVSMSSMEGFNKASSLVSLIEFGELAVKIEFALDRVPGSLLLLSCALRRRRGRWQGGTRGVPPPPTREGSSIGTSRLR
jgi:hypothetical protein